MTGIAAALKLTPLIFVVFLVATRQRRAGRAALLSFFGCGMTMLLVAPAESWSYWTKYLFDTHRVGGFAYIANQGLRSALVRFSHGHASEALILLVVLLAAIVGLSVAVWAYRSSSPVLGVLLCAVTGLLSSPVTWAHHLVWIVPVVLWLALARDRPAFGRAWAAVATLWFWYGAIWRIPHGNGRELHDSTAQLTLGNSYTIAMVLFVVGITIMLTLRRDRRNARSTSSSGDGLSEGQGSDRGGHARQEVGSRWADVVGLRQFAGGEGTRVAEEVRSAPTGLEDQGRAIAERGVKPWPSSCSPTHPT